MTHPIRTMFQPRRHSLLALAAAFGALCLTEGALIQGVQLTQEATAQEGPPGQGRGGGVVRVFHVGVGATARTRKSIGSKKVALVWDHSR